MHIKQVLSQNSFNYSFGYLPLDSERNHRLDSLHRLYGVLTERFQKCDSILNGQ
jgi:hypothetical protein